MGLPTDPRWPPDPRAQLRVVTGRIEGAPDVLDLLEALLDAKVDDAGAILLPKDLSAFSELVLTRAQNIETLRAEGRRVVEQVERLVCGLYEVPDDLTDEVIAHAVRRAAGGEGPARGVEPQRRAVTTR